MPLISAANGGHGLHDATTNAPNDPNVVDHEHPTANIGLRTGISFDVIDLDSESAVDALEQARDRQGTAARSCRSTGHGFHWYVKSTGLGNRAGVLPGVDFRGQRGYVVGSPIRPSRWSPIPLDQPIARRARSRAHWLIQLLVPERRLSRAEC